MTVEALTTFFGWMAVLNIAYLLIATVMLTVARGWVSNLHHRLMGPNEKDLEMAYFNWLGTYKIMVMVFSVIPYVALRLM